MASAVYGAKIMKDLDLIPEGYKIMVVGSVQEEDCDGMCWQYIVNKYFTGTEEAQKQDRVRHLHRAHRRRHLPRPPGPYGDPRGRARASPATAPLPSAATTPSTRWPTSSRTSGPSTRTTTPTTTEIKGLVKMLNPKYNPEHYEDARFLGRGTCTVQPDLLHLSLSRCAVADSCAISIDRRMTAGETWDSCLEEIRDLPAVQEVRRRREGLHVHVRPSRLDRRRL